MELLGFLSLQPSILQPRPRFALRNARSSGTSVCGVRMDVTENKDEEMPPKKKMTKRQERQRILRNESFVTQGYRDMKGKAEETIENAYSAEIVKEFRNNDFTLQRGDITWRLAKEFGFCWGVERSISQAFGAFEKHPDRKIWLTNEIIHNPEVNEQMKALGAKFIPVIDGQKDFSGVSTEDIVVLPAFGATLDEMKFVDKQAHRTVDTTCPYVSNVWRAMDDHDRKKLTSIVHGKFKHEETVATVSHGSTYLVVLNMEEAKYVCNYIINGGDKAEFLEKFKHAISEGFDPDVDLKAIGIANQTTMLKSETARIGKLFEKTMMKIYDEKLFQKKFVMHNTICNATQVRQDAMIELLDDDSLDLVIVVGGFNSSNTSHLQEMSELKGVPSYWIDRADRVLPGNKIKASTSNGNVDIHENFLPKGPIKIGITSGASSPNSAVQETIDSISLMHSLL